MTAFVKTSFGVINVERVIYIRYPNNDGIYTFAMDVNGQSLHYTGGEADSKAILETWKLISERLYNYRRRLYLHIPTYTLARAYIVQVGNTLMTPEGLPQPAVLLSTGEQIPLIIPNASKRSLTNAQLLESIELLLLESA